MKEKIHSGITNKMLIVTMILTMIFTLVPMVPITGCVEDAAAEVQSFAVLITDENNLETSPNYISSGAAQYNATTHTLTISDLVTKTSGSDWPYYGIKIATDSDVTIVFEGSNTVTAESISIDAERNIMIKGNANVVATGSTSYGIESLYGNVTIESGKIDITANDSGILTQHKAVNINDGLITVDSNQRGIDGEGGVNIASGKITVNAVSVGLYSNSESITITDGDIDVTASYGDGLYSNSSYIEISGGRIFVSACRTGIAASDDLFVSGGVTAVESDFCGVYAKNILVTDTGKISATVKNGDNKSDFKMQSIDGGDQYCIGKEFVSGTIPTSYCCISAGRVESIGEVVYYKAVTGSIVTQGNFISLADDRSNSSSATDIIFAKTAGTKVTLYGPDYVEPNETTSQAVGFVEKYVEADDGTLLPESKVYKYNDELHQKEVANIQNDVRDWRVVVRTKLGKKGIKAYAYLNGRGGEELDQCLASGKYTVQYDWYRSASPDKGYKYIYSTDDSSYYNTAVSKGLTYYYKCKITIYDKDGMIVRTQLSDCTKGYRTFK